MYEYDDGDNYEECDFIEYGEDGEVVCCTLDGEIREHVLEK